MESKRCAANLVMTANASHTHNSHQFYVVMHPESQIKMGSCLCGHHSKLLAKCKFPLQALLLDLAWFLGLTCWGKRIKQNITGICEHANVLLAGVLGKVHQILRCGGEICASHQ
jgi:hypothetical protein